MTMNLASLSYGLQWLMQVSVLVPLLVCWRNWPALAAPLRRLAWYFPLSIASVVVARGLAYAWALGYQMNNYPPIILFNTGKIVVLGWALRQALRDQGARRIAGTILALGLATIAVGLLGLPLIAMTTVARLAQCVVLAVVALAYLEQLSRSPDEALNEDPYFWLSTGQLVYSATTVVAISLMELENNKLFSDFTFLFISVAGLFQNFTLTKTYLAGRLPKEAKVL